MNPCTTILLLAFLFLKFNLCVSTEGQACESLQYVELGKMATVHCSGFQASYFGVWWFNASIGSTDEPFIYRLESMKGGVGFTSGKYDIGPNGSLLIQTVSFDHEGSFKVKYLLSQKVEPEKYEVHLIVLVKPLLPFPLIEPCGNHSNVCFRQLYTPQLNCSVQGVRPNISLSWKMRTGQGDTIISGDTFTSRREALYSLRTITRDTFRFSSNLVLLVCKANAPSGMFGEYESLILVQNNRKTTTLNSTSIKVERHSYLRLNCAQTKVKFLVWKKRDIEKELKEVLLYAVFLGQNFTRVISGGVDMGFEGSLIIHQVEVQHEGTYTCIYSDGIIDGVTKYEVDVYVVPVPAHPIVKGCYQEQNCVLVKERQGSLTCTVEGVRQVNTIEWSTLYDTESPFITFTNDPVKILKNEDTFNISLTSKYRVSKEAGEKLMIRCKASSPNMDILNLKATNVTLFFTSDKEQVTNITTTAPNVSIVPYAVLMSIIVVMGLFIILSCKERFDNRTVLQRPPQEPSKAEETPMLPVRRQDDGTMKDKLKANRKIFIEKLRRKYKSLYSALYPIPYLKKRRCCINTVFVDNGLQILMPKLAMKGHDMWRNLHSYGELLQDNPSWKNKRILEADLGYGKSTLALQLAYDWCNPNDTAHPMDNVEVLLFLKLGECKTVKSVYEAIKLLLLPPNSKLTDDDIKDIIDNTKSVAILLDGFQDYREVWNTTIESDFYKIIKGEMLQKCMVVLTTRTSVSPKESLHLMERFKLTKFNDDARRRYIRQAMTGYDDKARHRIEQLLEENSFVSDLCQSPLIFVTLAHMISANKSVQDLSSVTKCTRFMLPDIHSSVKNKLGDDKDLKFKSSKTNSGALSKVAFEILTNNKRTSLNKSDLMKEIGGTEYEQYQQSGIIVEKETGYVDIGDDSAKYIKHPTEVSFYHELFCEWFAAHHLSEYLKTISSAEEISQYLEPLDPSSFQYLFQFACGLDMDSAQKIIDHFINMKNKAKFAIPCIMEQVSNIDSFKETVAKLCQDGITISGHDNLLLQRSSMDILTIASKQKFPIKYVKFHNCFQSVDLSKGEICLRSGLRLSKEIPFLELFISLGDMEMTDSEGKNILKFSSMCRALETLWFLDCVPPLTFNDKSILSSLRDKETQVKWRRSDECGEYVFRLNPESGIWEVIVFCRSLSKVCT